MIVMMKVRRSLSGAKPWAAVASICLAGASTLLPWSRTTAAEISPGGAAAMYVSDAWVSQTAFDLSIGRSRVGWFVIACAVGYGIAALAGSFLGALETKLLKNVLASVILALALTHLGPYPGVLTALLSGSVMIWAASSNPITKETVE
ncbi:MAG: hypothetical protein ACP5VE_09960 [Chthonomonadales bacterium]